MPKLTISPKGLAFIKRQESFEGNVYIAPEGQPTVGYGHVVTAADREAHRFDHPITEVEAAELLDVDLDPVELYLNAIFPDKLLQGQFDALTSFCENAGLPAFENSTMYRLIKAGSMAAAAEQFGRWVYARDPKTKQLVQLPGLVKRRAGERLLFLGFADPPGG